MSIHRGLLVLVTCAFVTACVGPNYKRPVFDTTVAYKEQNGWKPSEPSDALDRGPWWEIFHDDVLNSLEAQIDISNQNVKAFAAQVEISRALVRQTRASFFPTVTASADRTRTVTGTLPPQTLTSAGLTGNWDVDLWGRIRRTYEGDVATLQPDEATLANARLSAQATLATEYFE
ncbi:MAG: TolC family protein, partial [Sinobacteraceae bacterium]|nr:TolC family protein [Nevskiaceae bacterium]